MNDKKTSAYRRIVSSTAIFGSAQILNILVNIIRGKLVAYILHSAGMGIASIFTSAANTIQQFALMGLNMSAVPSISQANNDADPQVLAFTIRLVRRIVLLASLLGLIVTVVLSPVLAHTSFNDQSYIPYFILLSLSVFFNVMGTGEMAVMQGLRRYKLLAFCSVVPPLCGLLLSVPIYFIWGIQGIVPAMIVVNLVYFVVIRMLSYRNKQSAPQERISMKTMWTQGRGIIKFGAIMTFGSLLGTLTTYALIAFISNVGSIEDVGFYQASNVITSQYTGLVFTAMATDYYPHLSSLVKTNMREAVRVINQQTEIIMLIIAPLASILILTAPLAIRILLTEEFLSIERMICFIGLASVFKALCFPRDYIIFAKGDNKIIFWVETVWGCTKTFTIMGAFYYYLGLDGLGYGALCVSLVDVTVSLVLIPWRYGFRFTRKTINLIIVTSIMATICLLGSLIPSPVEKYAVMGITTLVCTVYCGIQLNKRMELRAIISRIKNRHKKQEE